MCKLFPKPKDKQSYSPFLVINRSFLELYKLLLASLFFANLIQRTKGETCFEIGFHDYTLDCSSSSNEKAIMSALSQCGTYHTGGDDCARFFINTLEFCHGLFGGSSCTLDYHISSPDECAVQVISQNCRNGYGTGVDIAATIGIVFGGLIALCLLTALLMSFRRPVREAQTQVEMGNLSLSEQNTTPITSETEPASTTAEETTPVTAGANSYGTIDNMPRERSSNAAQVAGAATEIALEAGVRILVELPLHALSHCTIS